MATVTINGIAVDATQAAALRAAMAAQEAQGAVAYVAAISLTAPTTKYMAAHTVAGATAFTLAASPVAGASVYLRLTADGSNTPTFTGFKEWGGSMGYDNRPGIVNVIQFFHDGVDAWYCVTQQVGATPVDTVAPTANSAAVANASPSVVAITMSEVLDAGFVPAASAFTVGGHAVSSVAITGLTINLTVATPFVNGEAARTVAYTQPGANQARDVAGNLLASFSGLAITNNVAAGSFMRFNTLTHTNETGTGPYTYQGDGTGLAVGAGAGPDGIGTLKFQAGVDGYFQGVLGGFASQSEPILGVVTAGGNVGYGSVTYGIYGSPGKYQKVESGGIADGTVTSIAPANGDVIRVERVGTTLSIKVANAGAPTSFTTIHSWTVSAATAFNPHILLGTNCQLSNVTASGLA